MKAILAGTAVVAILGFLTGCSDTGITQPPAPSYDESKTLHVLAGSEIADMQPVFDQMEQEIGIHMDVTSIGTLDGSAEIANGTQDPKFNATWFPNNKFMALLPGAEGKLSKQNKIMSSPVVLGLKPDAVKRLGWDVTTPTWQDIVEAVKDGKLSYGMTSPYASNSGFSALIEASTALSNTGSALTDADITTATPALTDLYAGQKMTAGSSGWLAQQFSANPSTVDGIFNYESVIEETQANGVSLVPIIPSDGVVTADYPFSLLASAPADKGALYQQVVDYLMQPQIQKQISDVTHRNTTANPVNSNLVFELPFPSTLDTVQSLIDTYLNKIKSPSDMVFVIDTSGSMAGDRLDSLKNALLSLTNLDSSNSFVRFHDRESLTIVNFAAGVKETKSFDFTSDNIDSQLQQVNSYVNSLNANGGTAIYDAMQQAYKLAQQKKDTNPDHFVSVVLLTDGENTDGSSESDFQNWYKQQITGDSGIQVIPTFAIAFGDASTSELTDLATLTGGKEFNGNGDLTATFKDIRGYQ